jgi:hypothetical protein
MDALKLKLVAIRSKEFFTVAGAHERFGFEIGVTRTTARLGTACNRYTLVTYKAFRRDTLEELTSASKQSTLLSRLEKL